MRYYTLYEMNKLRINECFYVPACVFHHGLVIKRTREKEYRLGDLSRRWIIKGTRQDILDKIFTYGR